MSETLMALMKKGGGSGESDFLGENQYMIVSGDWSTASAIYDYEVGQTITSKNSSTHNFMMGVNVKGHNTATIKKGSAYDGVFGINNGELTQYLTQKAAGTYTIDISGCNYLFLVCTTASSREIIITN